VKNKICYVCGKTISEKDIIGLNKKLIDKNIKHFYCLHCLSEYFEVNTEFLIEKIEEFKNEGCTLF